MQSRNSRSRIWVQGEQMGKARWMIELEVEWVVNPRKMWAMDMDDEKTGTMMQLWYSDTIVWYTLDVATLQRRPHIGQELLPIPAQILRRLCKERRRVSEIFKSYIQRNSDKAQCCVKLTFVQRIIRVRLQEQILQANHDRVEIQNRLPVFSENV
jgi:hypothetical protein